MAVTITTQPVDSSVSVGNTHTFSVVASAPPATAVTTSRNGSAVYENDKDGNATSATTIADGQSPYWVDPAVYTTNGQFFFGCYARIDSILSQNAMLMGNWFTGSGGLYIIRLTEINGSSLSLSIGAALNNGWTSDNTTASTQPTLGQWHHFALLQRSGTLYLFLDGLQVASTSNYNGEINTTLRVGGYGGATGGFNGAIDKVFTMSDPGFDVNTGFNPADIAPGGALNPIDFFDFSNNDTNTADGNATLPLDASYQWFVDGAAVDGETATTFDTLVATSQNSYSLVTCTIIDNADNTGVTSDVALAISLTGAAGSTTSRHSLVFNYDDNNFTWKDPLVEIGNDVDGYALYDIGFQRYGFTPGWQERWEDYNDGAVSAATWATVDATKRWVDTADKGDSKEILQIANGVVYRADAVLNRQGSIKKYYVERTQMDLDDQVPQWTTNRIKQVKQFVFHMQSDQRKIDVNRVNTVDFYTGWSQNLMEDPNWKPAKAVNLEDRSNGGQYKVDYRTSGRYLSVAWDLTDSQQLAFTGGDIDANEVGGR